MTDQPLGYRSISVTRPVPNDNRPIAQKLSSARHQGQCFAPVASLAAEVGLFLFSEIVLMPEDQAPSGPDHGSDSRAVPGSFRKVRDTAAG